MQVSHPRSCCLLRDVRRPEASASASHRQRRQPAHVLSQSSRDRKSLHLSLSLFLSSMLMPPLESQAACLIRVPTEVVKSRQQTAAYGAKASSLSALRAVLGESGVRGLYRGYAGTVGREVSTPSPLFSSRQAADEMLHRFPSRASSSRCTKR